MNDSKFSIRQTRKDKEIQLEFAGPIDENVVFPEISFGDFKVVVLDLGKVDLLNSAGLRSWMYWMQLFPVTTNLILRNCTKFIVYQMNILDGFVPMGARVDSVFVPYYCENCGFEEDILALRGTDYMEATADRPAENRVSENRTCPDCQGTMEMSFFSSKYFRFLDFRR